MNTNNEFHHIVSGTPALPADLYSSIERDISRATKKRYLLFAIAAGALLSIVPLTSLHTPLKQVQTTEALPQEVLQELQTVSDYLNAEDMEDYTALYTLVDNY